MVTLEPLSGSESRTEARQGRRRRWSACRSRPEAQDGLGRRRLPALLGRHDRGRGGLLVGPRQRARRAEPGQRQPAAPGHRQRRHHHRRRPHPAQGEERHGRAGRHHAGRQAHLPGHRDLRLLREEVAWPS